MKYALTLTLACSALFFACSDSEKLSGTATDTENMMTASASVTGTVKRSDGTLAAAAAVRMSKVYSSKDVAVVPEYIEVRTDTAGVFAFDSAVADTFQLAVIDEDAEEISYLPRVQHDSKDLDTIKLEKAAFFESVMYYAEPDSPAVAVGSHFTVYMPGMPFSQSVFAGDSFRMMIPAGTWWFGFCPGDPQIVAKLQDKGIADSLIYRLWDMDSIEVKSGDTLDAGPFIWSTTADVDSLMKDVPAEEPEDLRRISGSVECSSAKSCSGIEVMVVTDIYGFEFEGDSSSFVAQTVTDSTGRWWLPVPDTVAYDSFRVEYRLGDSVKTSKMGLSRYVKASEVESLKDTLDIGKASLLPQSGLISTIALVIDQRDSTQSSNCMVNSVVVGAKGTAHFVRAVTCNSLKIKEMPAGKQELLLYSGDTKVISTLQEAETPLDEYVVSTFVNLPTGDDLEWQGMTYTPPTLPKSAK
jgi:hypothetical protein